MNYKNLNSEIETRPQFKLLTLDLTCSMNYKNLNSEIETRPQFKLLTLDLTCSMNYKNLNSEIETAAGTFDVKHPTLIVYEL